jgi:quinol monooxygenase YgiN
MRPDGFRIPPKAGRRCDRSRPGRFLGREHFVVTEFAKIQVKPGLEAQFERGIAASILLFRRTKGSHNVALRRSADDASRYWLIVGWDSVEAHTRDFAGTPDFTTFVGLISDCLAARPEVDHLADPLAGF